VNWNDGRQAILVVGKAENWLPFYATIVTERTLTQYQADSAKLYQALLEAVLPYLAGQTDAPPMPIDDWVEPELCSLAARRSWLERDREVKLADLSEGDEGYDGTAFSVEYQKARYPLTDAH